MTREERRKNVVEVLNKARAMELHAVHQYMNQHYNLDDKDYGELAMNMKLIAIDEMRHAEAFAERIKQLGGEPTIAKSADITRGQAVTEVYSFDENEEDTTIDAYNGFMKVCTENNDVTSAKLFERIIAEEQQHMDYFGNIAGHIEDLGDTYLAKIAGTSASTGPAKSFVATVAAE